MNESWSYPSVVGSLLYLATNTRLDIAFAVSQIGRFVHHPKKSHATAVKTLLRYLKKTKEFGTIIKPGGLLIIDLWVDSDFANLFKIDPDQSPTASKSRAGFLICLSDIPLLWKSFLMPRTCLSTTEAEYQAASTALRFLIPIRRVVLEMFRRHGYSKNHLRVNTTVHEDNAACYQLMTEQRLTNRTRYILTSTHWFWEYIHRHADDDDDEQYRNDATDGTPALERRSIKVVKVPTDLQRANYLTKGLARVQFERERKLSQGW